MFLTNEETRQLKWDANQLYQCPDVNDQLCDQTQNVKVCPLFLKIFAIKVEIFLEQREVAFLSPSKILLVDKNATYLF